MSSHSHKPSLPLSIVVGIVAGVAGIATSQLTAATSANLRSPVLDVGDRVVDGVPSWVKDLAIDWFGTNDKIALLAGIAVLLTVFAALLGVLALRSRPLAAFAGAALFGLIGALSALGSRTEVSITVVLPSILGAIAVSSVLWWAHQQSSDSSMEPATAAPSVQHWIQRRRFLAALAAISAVSVAGGLGGRRLEQRFSAEASRSTVALAQGNAGAPAVPAGAQATNAAAFFTPNTDFYRIDTALAVPQIAAQDWTLTIGGMVDTPIELTYDELIAKGLIESDITLTCVSNLVGGGLVGNARWQGIRLDQLLDEVGVDPNADQIVGRSADGYTCGFPVAALDGRDALVAVAMNGEPLPLQHGFPARLVVPGIYGYASATKWLTEIELTRFDAFDHFWVPRGYSAQAPIKMQTRIDAPRGLDRIDPGPFAIGGVAWAQPTGIKQVEVQIDGGPWQSADMATEVNTSTWRQWNLLWDATPGRHTITARAIDNNGAVQTADRDDPLPNGVTGHHAVVVLVNET